MASPVSSKSDNNNSVKIVEIENPRDNIITKCWKKLRSLFPSQPHAAIRNNMIDRGNISLDDVEKIEVDSSCAQSWPCRHQSTVFLKDGRKASVQNSYDICSIVSSIAQERINPAKKWSANDVKEHFRGYSKPDMGWEAKSPEEVLNNIFPKNN